MKKRILLILVALLLLIVGGCENDHVESDYFKVLFETFGGQYLKTETVIANTKVTRPNDPFKKGYVFDNWYRDENFSSLFDFDILIEQDITLFAKFLKELKVTLNPLTGSLDTNIINVIESQAFNLPNPIAPANYEFVGWYDENDNLFNQNIIFEDIILVAKYQLITINPTDPTETTIPTETTPPTEVSNYIISLDADGGYIESDVIVVLIGEVFDLPIPTKDGYIFDGWYDENEVIFIYNTTSKDLFLKAKYNLDITDIKNYEIGTYPEAIWIEIEGNYNSVILNYKKEECEEYILLDYELIRTSSNQTLIDIVGLESGIYELLITLDDSFIKISDIEVEPHDRSGYAHFNYSEGVGAYQDDGTLKADAVVVYVTDENKNNIVIPGISEVGLGWILNNAQYSSSTSNTYDQNKYNSSLAKFNQPIVFRLIGTINAPEGLTAYNSTNNGGSKGDNGFMARIKNGKNITIEGIGQGAVIFGWGIHFMASEYQRGISFEVRNLTFDKYPEDALGLEGVQSGNVLTEPVERGWIHHNTFKQGYAENPAESDKKYGDGSLDVKRGQYFTISYNQFLSTQKTNLIGASDSNLQYHFTYHHNLWYNVNSRVPLGRQANIHMYNNVFYTSDDQQFENSYVQNTRANAYIFSEANYFHATKKSSVVDGGAIKSYQDIKYSTYEIDDAIVASSRTQSVSSGNKYENFDTNPDVFYYDVVNQRSDVSLLTDAFQAKVDVFAMSGVYQKNIIKDFESHLISSLYPNVAINLVKDYLFLNDPKGKDIKILKGIPFYIFEITKPATITIVAPNEKILPRIVNNYGEEMLTGSGSVTLMPGIYIVEAAISHGASKGTSQAKETKITSLTISFD